MRGGGSAAQVGGGEDVAVCPETCQKELHSQTGATIVSLIPPEKFDTVSNRSGSSSSDDGWESMAEEDEEDDDDSSVCSRVIAFRDFGDIDRLLCVGEDPKRGMRCVCHRHRDDG